MSKLILAVALFTLLGCDGLKIDQASDHYNCDDVDQKEFQANVRSCIEEEGKGSNYCVFTRATVLHCDYIPEKKRTKKRRR